MADFDKRDPQVSPTIDLNNFGPVVVDNGDGTFTCSINFQRRTFTREGDRKGVVRVVKGFVGSSEDQAKFAAKSWLQDNLP